MLLVLNALRFHYISTKSQYTVEKFYGKCWIQHDLFANIAAIAAVTIWEDLQNARKKNCSMTKRMDFLAFGIHQNDILYAFIVRWTSLDILKAYFVFHWVNLHFFFYSYLRILLCRWLAGSLSHSSFCTLWFLLTHAKFNDGNANAYLFSMATNCSHFPGPNHDVMPGSRLYE